MELLVLLALGQLAAVFVLDLSEDVAGKVEGVGEEREGEEGGTGGRFDARAEQVDAELAGVAGSPRVAFHDGVEMFHADVALSASGVGIPGGERDGVSRRVARIDDGVGIGLTCLVHLLVLVVVVVLLHEALDHVRSPWVGPVPLLPLPLRIRRSKVGSLQPSPQPPRPLPASFGLLLQVRVDAVPHPLPTVSEQGQGEEVVPGDGPAIRLLRLRLRLVEGADDAIGPGPAQPSLEGGGIRC
mmetsp:Transcript_34541/g.101508  ORF Transcript_34541/g.101508 Transcript_34541/m.101508 type:complete len:242 (+) Transcript_34541:635-1360(+)